MSYAVVYQSNLTWFWFNWLNLFFPCSGLIVPESRGNETVPEVETTSGYALLHFFSDAAYNLTGFEIFYS